MNVPVTFGSTLAEEMERFVVFKRMQGYVYDGQVRTLAQFDRFLMTDGHQEKCLTLDVFNRYLASTAKLKPSSRQCRFTVVRAFSRHLHAYCPESPIMPNKKLPASPAPFRFFRLDPDDVRRLMDATSTLNTGQSVRPQVMRFVIGLLYATGLRIAEALKLNLGDVDLGRATIFVRRGKFGKDRMVVVSPSVLDAIRTWLELRAHHIATADDKSPFLIGSWNRRLTYTQAAYAFRRLCRQCNLDGERLPRLHDLRHNYACRRLALWQENGDDIEKLLPALANAMGHVNIFATQKYLHIDALTLQRAAATFNPNAIHHHKESLP